MQKLRKFPKSSEEASQEHLYTFGPFRLDPVKRLLMRGSELISLSPKDFDLLCVLVQSQGEVLLKEELMRSLWPDTIVEEGNLNRHISTIRRVLGESPNAHEFIVTVPGRGYRFVAAVEERWEETPQGLGETIGLVGEDGQALSSTKSKVANSTLLAPVPLAGSQTHIWTNRWMLSKFGKWVLVGVCALLALLLATSSWRVRPKPVLANTDHVMIADFTNTTNDPVFDDTLKQALSVQLLQSPYFNILSDAKIRSTLQLMTKPQDTKLTPDVAQELCRRAGCKIYISGSIANLGNQYVIGVKAIDSRTGDLLAQEQVISRNKESILKALDEAGTDLRKKLGESLSTVRKFDTALADATTPSLEALEAYSLGSKKGLENDSAAIPFYKRAVELDPNFASAYEALGVSYYNLGESGLARDNFTKAYELRERVSEREKYMISARYYSYVSGDLEKAIETYQLWQEAYPRDTSAHANLGGFYGALGQYEKAIDETLEGLQLNPDAGSHYSNLILSYAALGRLDEAKHAYLEEEARQINDPVAKVNWFGVAFVNGDSAEMDRLMVWSAGKPEGEDIFLAAKSDAEAFAGHVTKAQEYSRRAVQSALRSFQKETAAQYQLDEALWEAEFGNRELARQHSSAALALTVNHDSQILASLAMARTGDSLQAETMANGLQQNYPHDTLVNGYWLPVIRGAIELSRKDPAKAVKLLEAAAPYELSSPQAWAGLGGPLYPAYLRGWSYLALRQGGTAVTEFQKLVNHSGFMLTCPLRSLAYVGLARGYAQQGESTKARTAYDEFFALWKDADPDIPILKEAKAEYAKLQ